MGRPYGALAQLVGQGTPKYTPPDQHGKPQKMYYLVRKFTKWGISTVGSALHSHCRGHRFESGMLHANPSSERLRDFSLPDSRHVLPSIRRQYLQKGRDPMDKFIPKDKLSKKEKKRQAAERRSTWSFSPVTKRVESKKTYNRKRFSRARYEDGMGDFCYQIMPCQNNSQLAAL